MGVEYLILSLIVFMLVASLIAVEAKDLLSSVIAVGAAGFALSVIFLLVGAPDLAITQVVVEVIALVFLISAIRTRDDTSRQQPADTLRTGAVLMAGGILLAGAFFAVSPGRRGVVPKLGEPLLAGRGKMPAGVSKEYLARSARETGATNVVMGVLLDYRAYDTLGEATVILTSILGVYAILRRVGRRREGPPDVLAQEAPTS